MNHLFTSVFVSLYLIGSTFAQSNDNNLSDYLVTVKRDTVYGEITSYYNTKCHCINLKIKDTIQDYLWSSVLAYRHDMKDYQIIRSKKKNGNYEYKHTEVLITGKATLLRIRGYDKYQTHYVRFADTAYLCNNRKFSDKVWAILVQCESFAKQYESYANGYGKRKLLVYPKQTHIWKLMIQFYNDNCQT